MLEDLLMEITLEDIWVCNTWPCHLSQVQASKQGMFHECSNQQMNSQSNLTSGEHSSKEAKMNKHPPARTSALPYLPTQ